MTPDDALWGPADGGEAPSRFRVAAVWALAALALPTAGASCVPLWILGDRRCSRARAAGAAPSRDAVLLRDFGAAGTIVFLSLVGLALALAPRKPWD